MAEKIFSNVRLGLKVDTLENWNKSTLALKRGEVAIATIAASEGLGLTDPVTMIKIGEDGVKTFKDLSWNFYAKASDVLSACKDEDSLKTFIHGVIAEAGIASSDAMEALAKKVTAAEGEIDALQGLVGDTDVVTQIADAIEELDLANTYDAKGAAAGAESAAKTYADGLNTAMDVRVAVVEGKAHEHANAEELAKIADGDVAKWNVAEQNAKDYADDLDEAMDIRVIALEAKFGEGEGNVESQIVAAVAAEKTEREAADTALGNRVKAIEDDYLKTEDKTALQDQITANDGEIAALQELVGDTKVSEVVSSAVAAEAEIARAAEKANADAIAELKGNASVEGSVDKKIADAINDFATKASDDKTVNTYKELIDYAAEHGAEFTELVGVVDTNTKAIETLNGDANTAGSVDKKIADAIAGENLGQYAKDADLGAAVERIGAAEGEIDTLQSEMDAVEAKAAANETAIGVLNGLVGDTSVADQIEAAIAEENLAQYALAADLDVAEGKIEVLEGKAHEHENKTVLDGVTSEKVAVWDAAVQTVTAGTGLTATKTGTDVAIGFDDTCVFIFDCGTSAE